jgi:hypothetical protein
VVRFLIKLIENHPLHAMILFEIIHTLPNHIHRVPLTSCSAISLQKTEKKRKFHLPHSNHSVTPIVVSKASRFPLYLNLIKASVNIWTKLFVLKSRMIRAQDKSLTSVSQWTRTFRVSGVYISAKKDQRLRSQTPINAILTPISILYFTSTTLSIHR